MKKAVFAGCSFTAGDGWVATDPADSRRLMDKSHPDLWVNVCHRSIPNLMQLELHNVAQGGASNAEIFNQAVSAMAAHGSDIGMLVCQWTSMPRYNFNVGLELWDTSESFQTAVRSHDIHLSDGTHWTRSYINDLLDRLRVLHHVHWDIVAVVHYTNVITRLATSLKIARVFFVNGLCPWDKNYFTRQHNVLPDSYTNFTKHEVLQIKHRSDQDIQKLYNLAHQHYQDAGGIRPELWINLYQSFGNLQCDSNFDQKHPGTQSNLLYSNLVKQHIH
jgi:hypothetical protein